MSDIRTFAPGYGTGVVISATTTSASAALRTGTLQYVVTNLDTTNAVYVRSGDASVVAVAAADYVVPPGAQIPISRNINDTHVAAVAAAGTASVHFIAGSGI